MPLLVSKEALWRELLYAADSSLGPEEMLQKDAKRALVQMLQGLGLTLVWLMRTRGNWKTKLLVHGRCILPLIHNVPIAIHCALVNWHCTLSAVLCA